MNIENLLGAQIGVQNKNKFRRRSTHLANKGKLDEGAADENHGDNDNDQSADGYYDNDNDNDNGGDEYQDNNNNRGDDDCNDLLFNDLETNLFENESSLKSDNKLAEILEEYEITSDSDGDNYSDSDGECDFTEPKTKTLWETVKIEVSTYINYCVLNYLFHILG